VSNYRNPRVVERVLSNAITEHDLQTVTDLPAWQALPARKTKAGFSDTYSVAELD